MTNRNPRTGLSPGLCHTDKYTPEAIHSGTMASMIYVTTKDQAEAETIAHHLLEKRIIACANILPIRSIYTWKGKVEKEDEVAMLIKTRDRYVDLVMKEVRKVHSYEVPCIVSYKIVKGDKDYLDWIRDVTDVISDLDV